MATQKQKIIQLLEQLSEEQASYVIEYIYSLTNKPTMEEAVSAEMQAFLELDAMLLPAPHLDYAKELAEVRDEKYGYFD